MGQGVWDCVKCFECVEACPKEINPLEKITKLHNMQFEHKVAKSNVATDTLKVRKKYPGSWGSQNEAKLGG